MDTSDVKRALARASSASAPFRLIRSRPFMLFVAMLCAAMAVATARAAGSGHTLTFHGAMELLASIEELCLDGAG